MIHVFCSTAALALNWGQRWRSRQRLKSSEGYTDASFRYRGIDFTLEMVSNRSLCQAYLVDDVFIFVILKSQVV